MMGYGNDEEPIEEIINSWDCDKFRDFLKRKFEEYKDVVRGLDNFSMIFRLFKASNGNLG